MINNRQQNGRRRGRSNNNQRPQSGNSGGARNQDNGNRIDNRSRGNAAQLLEKYKTLARDAQQSGDRVLTEYYLQFSDHYFRVLADTRARYEENQPRRDGNQEQGEPQGYEDGEEAFDGDEFDPRPQSRVPSPQSQPRYDREPQQQESRERQDEGDRPRRDYGARPRNNSNGNGQDRAPRDDYRRDAQPRQEQRPREDRPRDDQRPREDRPAREDRPREDRPREDRAREDRPRQAREPRPVRDNGRDNGRNGGQEDAPEESTLSLDLLPPAIAVAPMVDTDEPVAPKRRGRPKKVVDAAVIEG